MRNDDLSQSGNHHPTANDDYDVIPAGSGSTANGNTITGRGTISGAAGADDAGVGGHITGITGAGAGDASAMEAHGRYGAIKIDAQGNYTYTRNHGSPDNVEDVFTYTLADKSGALDSARLIVRIEGKEEQAKIQDNAQRIVAGNEVITLPPGVELSDIHVVGRDLVIDLPDGTQMVITDGAVFVPQLALGDVEIPSDTLASLLIDSEPRPAAGPPQSSGGNFGEPVAPLDPGVPLGDLLPPTELNYTPPEFEETYIPQKPNSPDFIPVIEVQPDGQPASIAAQDNVDEAALPTRPGEPAGSNSAANAEFANGNIVFASPDGVASISISINGTNYVVFGPGAVTDIPGDYGTLHINSVNIAGGTISYTYTLLDNVNHQTDTTPWEDFAVQLVDGDGDVADATLRINIADDTPTANPDVDSVVEDGALIADGNVFSGSGGSDANATDGVADVPGADGATVTGVAFGGTAGSLGIPVQGTYGELVLSSSGAYVYTLHNDAPAVQALAAGETRTDVFTYTITDGDGDPSTTTLTITVTGTNDRPIIVSGSTAVTEEAFLAPEDNQGNPDGVGNPTDTASSASSSGQLSITDVDGDSLSVSLSAPAGSFYSHGQLIAWAVSSDGHTLTGSTGEGDVITVTIDDAGNYTVNLLEQIDHPVAGTSPATSEDIVDMVVGVHVNDGTVTVDGSLTVHVEDDSPIVTGEPVVGAGVDLDESDSGTPVLSPAGAIIVSSTGAIISAPVAYGGDGPGGAPAYTITLNGAVEGSVLSELKTADGDHAITLVQVDSTHINGMFNDGGDKVAFAITINADGSITVTQNYALEHNDDGNTPIAYNDSNSPLTLDGLITAHVVYEDFDHDTVEASGNIGQLIRFFDDGPSIDVTVDPKPVDQQAIDALALTTQDAGTEGPGSTMDSDSVNLAGLFHSTSDGGADGTASSSLTFTLDLVGDSLEAPGVDSGLESHDAAIYLYQVDAHTIIGSTSATPVGAGDASVVFALTTTDGGTVTLTQYQQIDHDTTDPTPGGAPYVDHIVSLANGLVNLVATGNIADNDGDTASDSESVDLGGLVRFQDDGPDAAVNPRYQGGTAILDETRDEGTDTPGASLPNGLASTTINFAGAFLGADYGADGAGSTSYKFILSGDDVGSGLFALQGGDTSITDGDGYGQGDEIVLNVSDDGLTVTGSAGGVDYFTLVMNPDSGVVTFTQLAAVWHPTPGDFDELAMLTTQNPEMLQVQQSVVDFDGDTDSATVNVGQGVFGIQDDGPDPFDGCPDEVIAINDVGASFTGDLHLPNVGEDQPGAVTFGVVDGDPVLDTMGNPISSGGDDLHYFINDSGVLEARAGGETGDVVFTITLNGDGSYTYNQVGDITSETELNITDLSSVGGGNVAAKAINVADSPFDLILSTKSGTTVNTNATEIGIGGGNSFQSGEVLRVDLVQNAFVSGSGGGAVLNFGEYYTANSYKQDVSGLGGAQTASFTVKAIAVNEAPGSGVSDPADGDNVFYGDTNDTFVTGTTLNLYNGSGTLVDPSTYASLGITVTALADGWQIEGLPNNYDFQIVSSTSFNAVQIEAISGTDTFKLGFIDITSTVQSDVDLQVPIALTDADGDAVTCDIDIHLGAPSNVPGVNATVYEAGLPIGSDAASASETVSGELAAIISGGTGPYTFAIVGSGDGTYGTLTIDPATGHYQYVLDTPYDTTPDADNGSNVVSGAESFTYSVTDANGVVTQATITVKIVDDVPTANDDAYEILEGDADNAITLNVKANDVSGADGTGLPAFTTLNGTYGTIVVNSEGQQTYTLNAAGQLAINALAPGATLTDTFTYSLTDGDGDVDPATVTITLKGTDDGVTITNLTPKPDGDAVIDEDDLLASRGAGESAGSDPTKESTTTTGDFNVSAPDGLRDVVIDGHVVIDESVFIGGTWTTPLGNTISVTAFDAATGKISYSYTLLDNEAHPNANGENAIFDDLSVVVTDVDTSSANGTLSIKIVDDVPTANDDAYEILEGDADNAITLNVKANDVSGADGTGLPAFTTLNGTYGTIVVNSEGQQTYTLNAAGQLAINALAPGATLTDTFTYSLTDGDGDVDPATVTITLKGTDDGVTITNLTPKPDGDAVIDEDDLLASRGAGESAGSDPTKESTTTTGDFNVSAPDGLRDVVIDGHVVIDEGVFIGGTWTTPLGNTISVTAFDAATGKISYSYTLLDNEAHPNANGENAIFDDLSVVVTDVDTSSANGTLSIKIVDDVPTANDDAYEILEGDADNAITLNVKANDVSGADGTGLPAFTTLNGTYGTIVVNSEGQQTYTLNAAGQLAINALAPGATLTDTFTYSLTDGDGDVDPATVTITLKGTDDGVTITNLTPKPDGDAVIDEDDLLASRGAGESAGSDPTKESTTTTGDFNVSAPDGLRDVVIDGHVVIDEGVFIGGTWTTPLGNTISVTAFDAATGKISYSYTLLDNEAHPNANGENAIFDDLSVVVTDVDTSSANGTLSIKIVDDVPTANDDAYEILEGDADNAITLNVKANDVSGADGTGLPAFTTLNGTYGTIVVNSEGQQTYTLNAAGQLAINALAPGATLTDTFTYSLTDGDGDVDPATVTITLKGTDDGVTITNLTPKPDGDAVIDEDDLLASRGAGESAGSDPTKESTTTTGDFNVSAPDGLRDVVIDGHVVIDEGVFIGGTWTTPLGNTISVTAFDAATGKISYSYTLLDNEAHPNANGENAIFDDLSVVVTDVDTSSANGTLSIKIVDDVPTANDDAYEILEGDADNAITLNVKANDVSGADGTGLPAFTTLNGTYGTIVVNSEGQQTYTLNAAGQLAINALAPGATLTDTFTYSLTDGDGDVDPATVTITLKGTDDGVTITNLTPKPDGDAVIDEDDLLASRGAGESAGSDPTKESTTTTGDFNVSAPDGLRDVVIDGHVVIDEGVFIGGTWTTPLGNTISVTAFDAATGKISYSYTLLDNEAHPNANGENAIFDDLSVVVTDVDTSSANGTLSIKIVDDVPTANDDAYEILEGDADNAITLNVKANDVSGADGTGLPAFTTLNGTYGTIVVNSEGQQTYTLNAAGQLAINALAPGATLTDTFTYSLTDGDGDVDPATVTITLKGTDDGVTITNLTPKPDGDAVIDEDDLLASRGAGESAGSDPTKESTTTTGDFNVSAPDGLRDVVIDGHVVIDEGVFIGGTWTTPLGNTISVTAFDAATGKISYSYTLLDNEAHPNANGENAIFDDLSVVVTDVDTSSANGTLSIKIVDDVPTANDDAYEILEGDADNAITLNVKANDVSGADGTGLPAFTTLNGTYGTIVVNSEGQQTYTLNAAGQLAINALAPGATLTDTFTYSLTDGDGDVDPATVTITLKGTDDGVTITNLTPKPDGDAVIDEDDLLASRGAGESAGSDPTKESTTTTGDFNVSAPDGLRDVVIDGHVVIDEGVFIGGTWTTPLGNTISVTAFDAATGKISYSYTLLDNEAHPNANGENAIFDDLSVVVTDVDTSSANGTLSIKIVDDVPTQSANQIIINLDEDELPGGIADGDGEGQSASGSLASLVVMGADGLGSFEFDGSALGGLPALTAGGATVHYAVVSGSLVAYTGANSADASKYVFTVSLTGSGNYTVTLLKPVDHVAGAPMLAGSGDDQDMTIDISGAIKFTDADGDPVNLDANSMLIKIEDDIPTVFSPQAAVTTNNAAGIFNGALDFGDAAGLTNNYGADGGKAVFTLTGLPSTQTSGGVPLFYTLSNGDQTLTATAGNGGPVVYTATISGSSYTLDIVQPIDSLTTVDFVNGAYDHPGGNPDYYGFFIAGNNDSSDLLLTAASGGTTVNLNSNLFGIGAGNSMDPGDSVRLDYVTDLVPTGSGAGQFTYEHHYNVNGATVGIAKANNATAKFTAYDDPDGNNTVGDGVKDTINQVSIKYGAGSITVVPTTTNTSYVVGGHTFWVLLNADGSVSVGGLTGDATGSVQSTVGIYTASGYNSLVVAYENGPHGNDTFKIGGFGAAVPNTDPVIFDIPVKIVDGDGDTVSGTPIHVTLNTPAPPVVLDTNHDGQIGFLGIDHGVLYDMNGDGHLDHTSWVAPGDSILFVDADGNGTVSGASEFVFGGNGLTDLEALHAMYGDQLDANDADFTMFGLWNDANSNGIVDAGEVSTLAEAGITSISLVSDGVSETAAGGDVAIAGSGTYTYVNDNGEYANGKLADASFAYRQAMTSEEQRIATSAGNASLLAIAAAAMGLAEQAAAHTPVNDSQGDGPVVDVAPVVTAATAVADDIEPQVSPLSGHDDLQPQVSQPAPHHNAVLANDSQPVAEHAPVVDEGPAALPQGTSLPVVDVTPLVDVAPMTVAGAAAAPTVGGGAHHNAVVVGELVTQPETSIEQILAKLGGSDAADQLAIVQGGAKAVQGWDMGDFTHLPIAAMEHMGAEASLLHPDAVQPVVHG